MIRKITESPAGEGHIRYHVVVQDGIACPNGQDMIVRQTGFMQELIDCAGALACGPSRFQTLKIHHDGVQWVAIAEAVV